MSRIAWVVFLLLIIISQVLSGRDVTTCGQALQGRGQWDNFTSAGWRPTAGNTVFTNTTLIELLSRKRLRWIAMVGDSNMRYLCYELVRRMCDLDSKCTLHAPFFDPIVKARGERGDISNNLVKSREIRDAGPRPAHLDFDVIVRRSGKSLRLSFRMVVGSHLKTIRALDNLDRQFCSSAQEAGKGAASNPCQREGIPMHNASFTASPSALIFNQGYWNLTSLLDRNITSQLFAKLADIQRRGRSRVLWSTLFHWRLDVMRAFDPKHYVDFSRDCNVTSTIPIANAMCKALAAQHDVQVLDLDRMAVLLDNLFATSVVKKKVLSELSSTQEQSCNELIVKHGIRPGRSWGTALADSDARKAWTSIGCDSVSADPLIQKKVLVTPDGVHQDQRFYGAAVSQIVTALLEC